MNVKKSKAVIENCLFVNNPADAIDGDWISGKISGNVFLNNGGDSVDLSGGRGIRVSGNLIFSSKDKGCSIGERTDVRIVRNFFGFNSMGIVSKDSSKVYAENNLFYGNETALSAYRKKPIFGFGEIISSGDFFCGNHELSHRDALSEIEIRAERKLMITGEALPPAFSPRQAVELAEQILSRAGEISWRGAMAARLKEKTIWIQSGAGN